ncbi:hypothetical protein LIER_08934 [Lithospermum erythrorhizon]|uniref:Uncharacterized protein n=1 Tax=Lithospermum erythrorhizon TaxID=34254 RepID=A0AAV3PIK8_LITER
MYETKKAGERIDRRYHVSRKLYVVAKSASYRAKDLDRDYAIQGRIYMVVKVYLDYPKSKLKDLFTPIIEVFEELEDDRDSEGEPQSLLLIMKTFRFVFMLHLMVDVLSVTNDLSEELERDDQDIVNAMKLVEINKKIFQKMRKDG